VDTAIALMTLRAVSIIVRITSFPRSSGSNEIGTGFDYLWVDQVPPGTRRPYLCLHQVPLC